MSRHSTRVGEVGFSLVREALQLSYIFLKNYRITPVLSQALAYSTGGSVVYQFKTVRHQYLVDFEQI